MATRNPSEEILGRSSCKPHEPSSTAPRIIYKKSGEVVASVLRPPRQKLVRSLFSPPKSVHFDAYVDVRSFMRLEQPTAISAESRPDRGQRVSLSSLHLDILTPLNPRPGPPVRLERLWLSADGTSLQGSVAVANIAYEKRVHCCFTVDDWQTVSEVAAAYASAIVETDDDRFVFDIALSDMIDLEHKNLILCLRYRVSGLEFWDNNNSNNFRVKFRQALDPATPWRAIEEEKPFVSFSAPSSPRPALFEDAVDIPSLRQRRDRRMPKLGAFAEVGRSRQSTLLLPIAYPGGGYLSGRYNIDAELDASRMVGSVNFTKVAIST